MTGGLERNSRCPVCGGRLEPGLATIPFLSHDAVVLIKSVPAEICRSCHEPYVTGRVADRLTELLNQLQAFNAEVSIIPYSEPESAPALTT
jgi:YgiT-type zinc finger domain-containing protein